jgi:hypothetical protein
MTDQVEDKVLKLLAVANHPTTGEHEALAALQLAQKLADSHNLEIGDINAKKSGRDDRKLNKGLYVYQRDLYQNLARMNHCRYWFEAGTGAGQKYQIRVLGSRVNVAVVKNMADYLEDVTNRMVRENFEKSKYFSKNAHAFRHGMIDRLLMRVADKQRQEEADRKRAKAEQQARSSHPSAAHENAIILMDDVKEREERENYDYLNGEGAWDAMKERQAESTRKYEEEQNERRIRQEEAQAAYEQWCKDNPKEYWAQLAAEAERILKAERKEEVRQAALKRNREKRIAKYGYDPKEYESTGRSYSYKKTVRDTAAYQDGFKTGADVGLDDQIEKQDRKGIK